MGHKQQTCIFSQLWRLEIPDPGAGKAGCILRAFLVLCGGTAISLDLSSGLKDDDPSLLETLSYSDCPDVPLSRFCRIALFYWH